MAEHTKLPWEAGKTGHGSPYAVYSDDATGSIIAMCQHTYVDRSDDEMIANVAMIVKAVNSHEPLVKALAAMVDRWEPDCSGTDRVMWEEARAALQEAGR